MKKTIRDVDVSDKRVLVRVDLNVPLKEGKVFDDTRIKATLPTIQYLREKGARTILCSHLDRPKGKVVEKLRLDPVACRLSHYLDRTIFKVNHIANSEAVRAVERMQNSDVLLLENTRFHPGEKQNDSSFARSLAALADLYVNDAFAAAHRAHASTEGVAHFLPAVAGLLMARETETIEKSLENPENPFVAVFGGSKVSDKIDVIESFLDKCDIILIGGGMANTFLKQKRVNVGKSKVENDYMDTVAKLLQKAGDRIVLPVDMVVAEAFEETAAHRTVDAASVPDDWHIMDIGPKTVELFADKLDGAGTVVWNGPLGVNEMAPFAEGTYRIARTLSVLDAVTLVGGGDSAAAVAAAGVTANMTHVSTGGGAFLDFLAGKDLPGLAALEEK
ncbi:MAG: phosphoglycerate kinase [Desulfatiglandaceae bacterium]